jgi:hypothetical protein
MTALFYPPKLTPQLVAFAQLIAPAVTRHIYRFKLVLTPEDENRLRLLTSSRLLLMPNHPTFQDPIVIFALSGRLGQRFHYLAATELFEGRLGPIMQQLGVYSIRRGLLDRPSISQTLDLLVQPNCRLVVFAEGGCSFQNDTVMPFRAGAIQMAFQALNRFAKQDEPIPDLYAVPLAIKYRYTQNMRPVIEQTLQELEGAFALKAADAADDYDRLRRIAHCVLAKLEQDYSLQRPNLAETSWNDRIALLREEVLQGCEQQLGLVSNPNEPVRERTYRLQDALKTREDILESEGAAVKDPDGSRYDYQLMERSVKRLLNFDAMYDGYVAENPTPERFLDTLVRLEREVFDIDKPPPKGFREAKVKVGKLVNLKEWFPAYLRDRNGTIASLTTTIQQAVQAQLDTLM